MYIGLELRKRARTDLSVCFISHAKKHIDCADKARGLCISFLPIKKLKKTRVNGKDETAADSTALSPFRCRHEVSTQI